MARSTSRLAWRRLLATVVAALALAAPTAAYPISLGRLLQLPLEQLLRLEVTSSAVVGGVPRGR
jgi:hypothetical protein